MFAKIYAAVALSTPLEPGDTAFLVQNLFKSMLQGAPERLICVMDLPKFEIWRQLRLCRAQCRTSIQSMSPGMFIDVFMIFYRNKYFLDVWKGLDGLELPQV